MEQGLVASRWSSQGSLNHARTLDAADWHRTYLLQSLIDGWVTAETNQHRTPISFDMKIDCNCVQ